MSGRVLAIGYGNSLRSDDAAGREVAERLALVSQLGGATVIGLHQLGPELALDIGQADLVVFVDAGHGPAPGRFTIERVARSDGRGPTWSHHLDPASLLALAHELYGGAPLSYLVTIGVESVQPGDRMSQAVEATIPMVVDAIAELVAAWGSERSMPGTLHA